MSGNESTSGRATPKERIDPRIRRTRDRLGDAMIELIQEQAFETITVQDVLDRAGVGRSTFYAHYKDKNDLFLSDVDEFFEMMATMLARCGEESDRIAPVRELFAHVAQVGPLYAAFVASGRLHDVLDLGRENFARGIERRLGALARARALSTEERVACSQAYAGALVSLLTWWLREGRKESPETMDDRYHRMVWSGIDGATG